MTPGGEETEVGLVKTVEDLEVHTVTHFLFLGGGESSNDDNLFIKCILLWLPIK